MVGEQDERAVHPDERRESILRSGVEGTPGFSAPSTGAYLLLWSILMVYGWSELLVGDPTDRLQSPAWSAARMTNRDLELAHAVEAMPPGERRFWECIYGSRDEVLANAVAIHQDVVSCLETSAPDAGKESESLELARAQLAVLLAESGEGDEAAAVARAVASPPDFAAGMDHAYGDASPPRDDPLEIFASVGISEWSYQRVAAKLAARGGEPGDVEAIEARILERGRRWLRRSNRILEVNLLLGLLGVVAGGLWVLGAKRERPVRGSADGPPWPLADGFGVLIRGDVWNRLYYLGLSELEQLAPGFAETPIGELLSTWGSLFASLPLLWLTGRYLLLPHRRLARDPLGLSPRPSAWGGLAVVALLALGIDLVGTYALGWGSGGLGVRDHWAEGFDENLVWGLPRTVLLTGVDYVVWAPAMEELAFRGVLFFSLRRRFGPASAALLSAAIFSLIHFYGLSGFLMTFWSGLIWALAFERTRSLWPGVAAHAVYNLLYVFGLVLVYR